MDKQVIEIKREEEGDQAAIRHLNEVAFDKGPEAAIVDKLRDSCGDYVSFVAVENGNIVGHILFTPVTLDNEDVIGMGLAPMAVEPTHQRQGVGTKLVLYGLEYLRESGYPFVIVLGHPEYYPRFGFERASKYRLQSQWEGIPDEVFMVVVFNSDEIPKHGGVIRYRDEFNEDM